MSVRLCVVMRNTGFVDPHETPALSPLEVVWKSEKLLGPLGSFVSEEPNGIGMYWRFYLVSDLKRLAAAQRNE